MTCNLNFSNSAIFFRFFSISTLFVFTASSKGALSAVAAGAAGLGAGLAACGLAVAACFKTVNLSSISFFFASSVSPRAFNSFSKVSISVCFSGVRLAAGV